MSLKGEPWFADKERHGQRILSDGVINRTVAIDPQDLEFMSINAQSTADLYAERDGREPDLLFRMRARADHRQVCRCRRCVERSIAEGTTDRAL